MAEALFTAVSNATRPVWAVPDSRWRVLLVMAGLADADGTLIETVRRIGDFAGVSERQAMRRNAARVLAKALDQITDDQRAAIVLYDVEGYDYQEIADMTGAALGTVKSRIHRGRLALRELLGDNMELLRE